ncbi:hypothetical protein ebA47 [Aromatoleum aromaticum EbN1]|uniref:Uncharacterized protein n=1 Tax=Aromatoleum aromaticum (strain DSM 19018 / LMG 30748 / EbN1) TaxID=76114 RepID=Q5P963_AROAE|nr:hypothetical protein ebA47 [Aromatoleum aromaticum EbN1]
MLRINETFPKDADHDVPGTNRHRCGTVPCRM